MSVKTPERQGTQRLHRICEYHEAQCTKTINLMCGLLREFGVVIPSAQQGTSNRAGCL